MGGSSFDCETHPLTARARGKVACRACDKEEARLSAVWTQEDCSAVMSEDASAESVRAAQTAFPAAARRHQPIPTRP